MSTMSGWGAKEIADAIEHEIRTGVRQPGSQLPSQNVMAAALRVHRSTVATAYAYLGERGLTRSRRGAGTFVAELNTLAVRLAARPAPDRPRTLPS